MKDQKFLCSIQDRKTGEVFAYYEIEAADWYYARHQAADKFSAEHLDLSLTKNWYADSVEI